MLTIDLDAIAANFGAVAHEAPGAECAAVVKADAYGLGLEPVAAALAEAGCRTFFVATFAEGVALRARLPQPRIFVFEGPAADDAEGFIAHRLGPVLNSLAQIDLWRAAAARARSRPPAPAVQIDTGMARLGLSPDEVSELAAAPERLGETQPAFVMSHLACAEEPDSPLNARQRERFDALRALLPAMPASLANSAGCRLGPAFHYDLVRPGIALFGGYAGAGWRVPIRSAVRLQAPIIQVRQIDRPETVGYGATHAVTGATRVATLALGYADGYKRGLGNRGMVAVGDRLVPVLGRVSMDLTTVDVTRVPAEQVQPNMLVEVLGPAVPLDAVAAAADTIPHDVLTGLGRRFARVYRGAGAPE